MKQVISTIKYRIIKDLPFRNVWDIMNLSDIVAMFENDYYKSLKWTVATLRPFEDPILSEELQKYFKKL